jgi:hypothetical protein
MTIRSRKELLCPGDLRLVPGARVSRLEVVIYAAFSTIGSGHLVSDPRVRCWPVHRTG